MIINSLIVLYYSTTLSVRFHVLAAASMKVTAFWDVTPCSLVEVRPTF
jgi:hypothetical protein